jgi:hypothetical protein
VEVESDDSDLDDKPVKTVKPVPKGNKPKK